MNSPRPTPLTDEEGVRFGRIMINWCNPPREQVIELVPADFARQLERDRGELIEALRGLLLTVESMRLTDRLLVGCPDSYLQGLQALLARLSKNA